MANAKRVRRSKGKAEKTYSSAVAVERAIDLLAYLSENGPSTITEMARSLETGTTAVHRIVTALHSRGIVDQDEVNGRYHVTWGILALARSVRGQGDIRDVARPHLAAIADETEETVSLAVRRGFERLTIDQVESMREMRWVGRVGQWSPLYVGASGRAILAALTEAEVDEYLASVRRYAFTPKTLVDEELLREDIASVRRRGYSVVEGDRVEGLSGLSVPIFDGSEEVAAAITIGVPSVRAPKDFSDWAHLVGTAAHLVSQALGYQGDPFVR